MSPRNREEEWRWPLERKAIAVSLFSFSQSVLYEICASRIATSHRLTLKKYDRDRAKTVYICGERLPKFFNVVFLAG
jgi:hypothetical protein